MLPAAWPLLRPGFFVSDDGLFHIYRTAALADAWRQGVLYPRLFPDFGFGYGQAVLNYYAPLTYVPWAFLALLGLAPVAAAKATIVAGLVLAALAAYGYVNSLWGPRAGLLAAVAYTYFPYHLADFYVRGAIPEGFAFIWPPLILWAYTAAWRSTAPGRPLPRMGNAWLWGALAWAGLVYTHNLTALMFVPVFALYLACLAWETGLQAAWRRLLALAGSLVLAAGLSAPLWLPFFVESKAVGLGWDLSAGYVDHLAPPRLAVQIAALYHYRAGPGGLADHPLSWLTVALFVGVLALGAWRLAGRRRLHDAPLVVFALLVVLTSGLMTTTVSLPIWRALQPGIESLQYPWRFLAVTAVGVALLAGALCGPLADRAPMVAVRTTRALPPPHGPEQATPPWAEDGSGPSAAAERGHTEAGGRGWAWVAALLAAFLFIAAAAPLLPDQPLALSAGDTASPLRMWQEDAAHGQIGATWTGEFLPTTVQEQRWALGRPRAGAVDGPPLLPPPQVSLAMLGYQAADLIVSSTVPLPIRLHQFCLPGWGAAVDGRPVPAYASGPLGLVTVDVPAGRHEVTLRFGPAPARTAGAVLASLAAVVWAWLAWRKRGAHEREGQSPMSRPAQPPTAGAGGPAFHPRARWSGLFPLLRRPMIPGPGEANGGIGLTPGGGPRSRGVAAVTRVAGVALVVLALALDANGAGIGQRAPVPHPVSAAVPDVASLLAYDAAPLPGAGELAVTLDWFALREPGENYKAFVHLVGPNGQVVAQDDRDPVGGFTPTSRWEPGELIEDRHYVALPAGLQPGAYRLKAGLYSLDPRSGGQARNLPNLPATPDGRIDLGEITLP